MFIDGNSSVLPNITTVAKKCDRGGHKSNLPNKRQEFYF